MQHEVWKGGDECPLVLGRKNEEPLLGEVEKD